MLTLTSNQQMVPKISCFIKRLRVKKFKTSSLYSSGYYQAMVRAGHVFECFLRSVRAFFIEAAWVSDGQVSDPLLFADLSFGPFKVM